MYQTKYNGTIIKTGTLMECWKNLVDIMGSTTIGQAIELNVTIEKSKEI